MGAYVFKRPGPVKRCAQCKPCTHHKAPVVPHVGDDHYTYHIREDDGSEREITYEQWISWPWTQPESD